LGIIRTQTIKGTAFTYLGAVIGVITNLFLLAKFFTTEQVGLISVLVAYSLLFAQFASLGFDNVTIRLFPYFRSKSNNHNGFLFLLISTISIGFVLSTLLFFVLKPYMIENIEKTTNLFAQYANFVIPLAFSTLLFNSFDAYSRVLYKSVRGIFLKEFLQRILIVIAILLYILHFLNFNSFIIYYSIALSLPTIILFILIFIDKQLNFKRVKGFVNPELRKSIISVTFYGIIAVFSSSVILSIDRIMIERMLGLSEAGIYSIAFFFGVIISMPSRALAKISSTIVADAWKNNDFNTIRNVYYKSCLNQMIFSVLLFIGIWANIDNVFHILPVNYLAGKFVIFWVCLGSFIDMSTGINSSIIATSKYYRVQSIFMTLFVLIIIVTNYIFIPYYNITGAGMANAISLFLFNLMRWLFLWIKFDFQPFNYKYLIVFFISAIAYFAGYFLPKLDNFIIDIIVRSSLIFVIFSLLIYFSKVSEDINGRVKTYYSKIFIKKN